MAQSMARNAGPCQGRSCDGWDPIGGSGTSSPKIKEVRGLNADLASRSERGRPSGKGRLPGGAREQATTHAPLCRRRAERPVRDGWPYGEVGQNLLDGPRLVNKGDPQRADALPARLGQSREWTSWTC